MIQGAEGVYKSGTNNILIIKFLDSLKFIYIYLYVISILFHTHTLIQNSIQLTLLYCEDLAKETESYKVFPKNIETQNII